MYILYILYHVYTIYTISCIYYIYYIMYILYILYHVYTIYTISCIYYIYYIILNSFMRRRTKASRKVFRLKSLLKKMRKRKIEVMWCCCWSSSSLKQEYYPKSKEERRGGSFSQATGIRVRRRMDHPSEGSSIHEWRKEEKWRAQLQFVDLSSIAHPFTIFAVIKNIFPISSTVISFNIHNW